MASLAMIVLALVASDFTISGGPGKKMGPVVDFRNNQHYVFWTDLRSYPAYAAYGARVSAGGTVLDPEGRLIFSDTVVSIRAAYDGSNFLLVWREGC